MDLRSVRTSLYRFLVNRSVELGIADITILPGISGAIENRPLFVAQALPGGSVNQWSKYLMEEDRRFNVMFLTNNYGQAENVLSHIERKLVNNRWKMTGVLVEYQYPSPVLIRNVAGGTLAAGTYHVAVTGRGYIDNVESLPSQTQSIAVGAGDSIQVIIPRSPRSFNWFKTYNVYVGSAANALKKTANSPVSAHLSLPTSYEIETVPVTGDAPPAANEDAPSVIKYRFLTVLSQSWSAAVLPEPGNEAGAFAGMMNFVLRAPMLPVDPQARPIESVETTVELEE